MDSFSPQAFEDVSLHDDKDLQNVLYCLDITFVVIFSLEFLLKLIGLGFVRYFTNGWNCLDLTIVIVSQYWPNLNRTYCIAILLTLRNNSMPQKDGARYGF